jgi:hypothetical protein
MREPVSSEEYVDRLREEGHGLKDNPVENSRQCKTCGRVGFDSTYAHCDICGGPLTS